MRERERERECLQMKKVYTELVYSHKSPGRLGLQECAKLFAGSINDTSEVGSLHVSSARYTTIGHLFHLELSEPNNITSVCVCLRAGGCREDTF